MFSVYHINFHFDSLFSCPLFASSFPTCSASFIACNFTPPSLSSKHRRPTALFIVSLTTSPLFPRRMVDRLNPTFARSYVIYSFILSSVRFDVHVSPSRCVYVYSAIQLCLSPPRFSSLSTSPHALGLALFFVTVIGYTSRSFPFPIFCYDFGILPYRLVVRHTRQFHPFFFRQLISSRFLGFTVLSFRPVFRHFFDFCSLSTVESLYIRVCLSKLDPLFIYYLVWFGLRFRITVAWEKRSETREY